MKEQIGPLGILMLDIEGIKIDQAEKELLQRSAVGGIILFSRNYESPSQLKDLVSCIRELRPGILIAVDQEGGRVQRFRNGFLTLPALKLIGDDFIANNNSEIVRLSAWAMAAEVLHYGIDLSFAPVLDLQSSESRVIGNRAFSNNAQSVIKIAAAYIEGMNNAGMKAIGKHFPGHGTVKADSHMELPCDERKAEEILANDYLVFAELASKLNGIMPAHVKYLALDESPAGYSKFWIQKKLRDELCFEGVVFSDDLSMVAAKSAGSASNRAALALEAGCDMLLICNDRSAAIEVADWIERESVPQNGRIAGMRAEPAKEIANLYESAKWQKAKAIVNSLMLT